MGTRNISTSLSLVLIFGAFARFTDAAVANTRCNLIATPVVVHLGESITLTLDASADVTAAFIDDTPVSFPHGSVTITASALSAHGSHGKVVSPAGEFFCNADYTVLAPLNATLVGDVVSATTGRPLAGVSIALSPGGVVATSDGGGAFNFTNVALAPYNLNATLAGYTTEAYSGVATTGTNAPIHLVLNPILAQGQVRIVLTWGETPSDLDSHLFTTWDSGQKSHIYYVTKTGLNTTLDVDDTSSLGPETVTITAATPGRYSYAVFDYTHGNGHTSPGEISSSKADVKVYEGNNLISEFRPTNAGGKEYTWHVCDINISPNGNVTVTPFDDYSNTDLDAVATFP